MKDSAEALGQRAAQRLAEEHEKLHMPRQQAAAYVAAIVAAFPKAKLPALLKLEETKELLSGHQVTKSMLAEELTKARAELKAMPPAEPITIPKAKRQGRAGKAAAVENPRSGKSALPAEPDTRPPSLPFGPDVTDAAGRVPNGSISDL